jgi:cytochrome c oxidase assembly protein subunit 11
MVLLTIASVPLYQMFCAATGYGGTPKIAVNNTTMIDRVVTIRFNADVDPKLPWKFLPAQKEIKLHLGETGVAYYNVENHLPKSLVGIATYNVTPLKAGQYFNKVECFCFTDQLVTAGESKNMPVTFFIDPKMDKDRHLKDLDTITLSYTFFPSEAKPEDIQGLHRDVAMNNEETLYVR